MSKQKYYVVWKGRKTGIFNSWEECMAQTDGFEGAEFKAFKNKATAEKAFIAGSSEYIGGNYFEKELTIEQLQAIGKPELDSICVDAAWNTVSRAVEYQGILLKTKELLFHQGPFDDGTINVAEFLAIVHALGYCKQRNIYITIYSDSRNAINWVKHKSVRTDLKRTEKNKRLFELIDRALKWLNTNDYQNKILKWDTKAWGENPADFKRK